MRKLIVGATVSMDGVMQAPGGPTEDPTKGFTFGGWVPPYFCREFGEELDRVRRHEHLRGAGHGDGQSYSTMARRRMQADRLATLQTA